MHQNLTGTECGGVIACAKLKVVMQTLMRKSCLHQGVSSQGWMTNGKARCRVRHAINLDFVKKTFWNQNSYNLGTLTVTDSPIIKNLHDDS